MKNTDNNIPLAKLNNAILFYNKNIDNLSSEGANAKKYIDTVTKQKKYQLNMYGSIGKRELLFYFFRKNKLLIIDKQITYNKPFYYEDFEVKDSTVNYIYINDKIVQNNSNLSYSTICETYSTLFNKGFNEDLENVTFEY